MEVYWWNYERLAEFAELADLDEIDFGILNAERHRLYVLIKYGKGGSILSVVRLSDPLGRKTVEPPLRPVP